MADAGPLYGWIGGVILFAVLLVALGSKLAVQEHQRQARAETLRHENNGLIHVIDSLQARSMKAEGLVSYLQQDPHCQVR